MSKNTLIIVANPREESLSFSIAQKYESIAQEKETNVKIIDLYKDKNIQGFFTYEDSPFAIEVTKEMRYYQNEITKADEIVFVFPYWWGSMPAILKNFFDWNLSSGFAYTYINSRPVGLLQGKTVKVFTTTGAPSFLYKITGAHRRLRNMFKKQIIEFCGMELKEFNIFGSVDTSAKNTDEILSKIN